VAGYGLNFALPFDLFCGHCMELSRQPDFGHSVHGERTVLTYLLVGCCGEEKINFPLLKPEPGLAQPVVYSLYRKGYPGCVRILNTVQ